MSRWTPYLNELQPAMFLEVSPELAAERGLEHTGWATVVTARSAIEGKVLVTERAKPLRVGGKVVRRRRRWLVKAVKKSRTRMRATSLRAPAF